MKHQRPESTVRVFISQRYLLSYFIFLGSFCIYIMRYNMSVAIVCMTHDDINENNTDYDNGTTSAPQDDCPYQVIKDNGSSNQGEFDWSRSLRGFILSSFFIGYLLTQIGAGWVAKKVGCKRLILIALFTLTIATLLTPVCARASVYLLIAIQIIKGGASGLYYPSMFQLWSFWAPPDDRSTLVAISMGGAPIGAVFSSIFSGLLCEHGFDGGWPSIFYIFGIISLLWCILWFFVGYDSPSAHPRISLEEREYIEGTLGNKLEDDKNKLSVPWSRLLTSLPFCSLVLADFVYSWGWQTGLSVLPQYMKDVLKFNITANGLFNALPNLCNFAVTILASLLADALLKKEMLSMTWTRKLLTSMALIPSAIFAVGVAFLNCHQVPLAITCLCIWIGMLGCARSGSIVNVIDLAPVYAGVLNGIDQTVSTIPGIVAPYLTGVMTPEGKQEQWRNVFLLGAILLIIGWIVYLIFGSGDEQEWGKRTNSRSKENLSYKGTESEPLLQDNDNAGIEQYH